MSSALGFEVGEAYARLSIKKMELTLLHMLSQGTSTSCCSLQGTGATGTDLPTHCSWDAPLQAYLLMSEFLQLKCVMESPLLRLRAPATQLLCLLPPVARATHWAPIRALVPVRYIRVNTSAHLYAMTGLVPPETPSMP